VAGTVLSWDSNGDIVNTSIVSAALVPSTSNAYIKVNSSGSAIEEGDVIGDAGGGLLSVKLTTPQIKDTSKNHFYIFAVNELTANRTVTLPLLGANDEFVFKTHAVTMVNKTFTNPTINAATLTGTLAGTPTFSGAVVFSGNPNFTGAPTLVGATFSGDILPAVSDASDLGSSSVLWGDIYLGDDKSIKLGDAQDATLTFGSGSGQAVLTAPASFLIFETDGTNNAISYTAVLRHATSGTAANNIGVGLAFEIEHTGGGVHWGGSIDVVLDDATDSSEESSMRFRTSTSGGSAVERARISAPGDLHLLAGATFAAPTGGGGALVIGNADSAVTNPGAQQVALYAQDDSGGEAEAVLITEGLAKFVFGRNISAAQEIFQGGLLAGGLLIATTTATGAEDDLKSYTIPAGLLPSSRGLAARWSGNASSTTGVLRVKLDGTTVHTINVSDSAAYWSIYIEIFPLSTTAVQMLVEYQDDVGGTETYASPAGGETVSDLSSNTNVLLLTGQTAAGNLDHRLQRVSII
jgi:hypothetical protein